MPGMRLLRPIVLLAVCVSSASAADSKLLIRGAGVFDGEKSVGQPDVLIEGGRIAAVGVGLDPAGARVIEARGHTLLPGLIDSHVHIIDPQAPRAAAVFGVTTELDMFMFHELARQLRSKDDFSRADFRTSGTLVTAPGGHGTEYGLPIPTLTAADQAQQFVDARIAEGSDYIKLIYDDGRAFGAHMPTISRDILAAVVRAAHERHKLAVTHISDQQAARDVVDVGGDGLAHVFFDSPADDAFIQSSKAHKIFVVPTLAVLEGLSGSPSGLENDERLKPMLRAQDASGLTATFPHKGKTQWLDNAKKSVRALHDAGVPLLAGTDAPNPGTVHGASLHRELELLVACGLTPAEALAAATSVPARTFGLSDRGHIAAGQRADLLLVRGDPSADIKSTRDIQHVFVAGHETDRDAWRKSAQESRDALAKLKSPGGLLISDFEAKDISANFGAGWSVSTDELRSGKSTCEMKLIDDGADRSKRSLHIAGEIKPDFAFPWAGALFSPGAGPMQPADLSAKKAVSFWAKGDGKTVRIMLFAKSLGFQPAMMGFTAGPQWQRFSFEFAEFGKVDGKDMMGILFSGGPASGKFEFQVDQVELQ